ncbi:hypothetical protein PSTT_15114, partial [Puccinia striiformis]
YKQKEGGKKEIIPSGFLIEDSANRTFLSPQYFNESVFANGDNVTCQPAPMKLSEDFCTVIPIKDVPRVSVSSQGYQWTICAVIPPSGPNSENTTTGFLYSGEKLNCTSVYVHHTYSYQTGNFKFNLQRNTKRPLRKFFNHLASNFSSEVLARKSQSFEATNDKPDGGSGFEIDVKGLGSVRPLGQLYNFSRIPVVWALVFNNSLSMNSGLMGAANADLNGKQIGVNYLCTNTTKEWQSVPKVLSITVGSTLAVFSACFTLLVAVARRLDDLNFKRTDHLETDQLTDSHTQAILKLEDGEVVRLHTTSVEQQN